jgi:transcriptional regulator with XRE-family HTH domain
MVCLSMSQSNSGERAGAVVGRNVKRLRRDLGWSQEEFAAVLRFLGLNWTRSNLASLESGRRRVIEVETLLQLARGLNAPLSELFSGAGAVRVGGDPPAEAGQVLEFARGGRPWGVNNPLPGFIKMARASMAALEDLDREAAARIGVAPRRVRELAQACWGRSIREEQAERMAELPADLAPAARGARRGHLIKQLDRELRQELTREESK